MNKNILITGAAGFIASAVTNLLVNKYSEIKFYGLDKMSYCSNEKNLKLSIDKENFKFIQGDICEIDFMKFIFSEYKIDTVMHFAAYSHVDHSFGNSLIFSQNNIIGTHTLLEVSKINKIKLFIHISTDEVYGDKEGNSDEYSLLDPTNPYSASKAAAENLVRGYYHSFKLPVIITRGNNVYGPTQYPEKAIPRFCLRLLQGKKCEIQGSGQQTRSFLYIDDVADAFELILFKGKIGEIYNIGSDREISILEVITLLINILYPNLDKDLYLNKEYISFVTDRDFNDQRYNISSNKLKDLGWSPKINFEEGLKKTLEWYRQNFIGYWENSDLNIALEQNIRKIN
jgi:dTDP-glucose 4,6-dehydratase